MHTALAANNLEHIFDFIEGKKKTKSKAKKIKEKEKKKKRKGCRDL